MKLRWIVAIMFALFLIEGTIMPWLLPTAWIGRVVPQFTLIFVLFASLYSGRHAAFLLGACFGLLQDVVYYGHMIGGHSFAMGLCGYLTGLLFERRRLPMLPALSVIGMSCLLYDTLLYFIYTVFRISQEPFVWALMNHIMPSLFLQLVFAIALYIPARRWFEGSISKNKADDEE